MVATKPALAWIAEQDGPMCERIVAWSRINSGTFNVEGIGRLGEEVERVVAPLCDSAERVALEPCEHVDDNGELRKQPLGGLWIFRKRRCAPRQILLAVHLDTVFPADHPFQRVGTVTTDDGVAPGRRILRGPGVCDAKGGLAVLWTALEAFESFRVSDDTGWTVILNPDEEIGSPGSAPVLAAEAQRADLGLVFEPALSNGAVVAARKGSGNFSIVARGSAAHVGRAFADGRSAIHALSELNLRIAGLAEAIPGVVANVGYIRGGGAVNVVADFALARCNVRVDTAAQQKCVETLLAQWCREVGDQRGVSMSLHGGFLSPPKPLTDSGAAILEALRHCAEQLGTPLCWRDTGGVCDGNRLAAAGLPNLDTLGPVGGDLHSEREYLDVDSLVPRAQLVALLMSGFAEGAWTLPVTGGKP